MTGSGLAVLKKSRFTDLTTLQLDNAINEGETWLVASQFRMVWWSPLLIEAFKRKPSGGANKWQLREILVAMTLKINIKLYRGLRDACVLGGLHCIALHPSKSSVCSITYTDTHRVSLQHQQRCSSARPAVPSLCIFRETAINNLFCPSSVTTDCNWKKKDKSIIFFDLPMYVDDNFRVCLCNAVNTNVRFHPLSCLVIRILNKLNPSL